jgi:hypothetical protein
MQRILVALTILHQFWPERRIEEVAALFAEHQLYVSTRRLHGLLAR